jgi:imidazolonepropionase
MKAELIIHSAAQLATCAGSSKPKRREAMREVGIIPNGAIALAEGQILAVGTTPEILAHYTADEKLDVTGKTVCPGFVDAHTHLVYGGDRLDEFELRIIGKSYMEIMQTGGGIQNTVAKTRAASPEQLVREAMGRLDTMLKLGTTTAEVKTGYGLDTISELKMLQVIEQLAQSQPIELVPTFLGAHSLPPEYKADPDRYVQLVIEEMLPAVARWYAESYFAKKGIPCFIDVFCEQGVFDVAQTRRVLTAGKAYNLAPKIHVDEFVALGGTTAGIELGAISLDHLDHTPPSELAKLAGSNSVAVIIPAVNFNLGSTHYAPARTMLDKGVALALATDINPGSAPCPSIPLVMAIAARYQRLLPAETLNAVTLNAAYALAMGERVGSLETGKQADLLVLDVPDYRHLAYQFGGNLVQAVYKRGRRVV